MDAAVSFQGNCKISLKVVFATTPADIGFLAAEKAKRTPVVGNFLTAIGTITFERPQDLKKKLVGKVTVKEGEESTIIGEGTSFTKDYKIGDLIHFPNTGVSLKSFYFWSRNQIW